MNSPLAPGDILDGKYRIERVLGAGGMGVVVAATHLELNQLVAMKFLLAEGVGRPDVAARFIREARAAARIRGEHVARVLDVGRLSSGSPYIVMEYLEGRDLEHVVRDGPLSVENAVDYVIQACDAMAEAHRLGIVHRDLKPANLFLTIAPDGREVIKVLDFGISKSLVDDQSKALTNASALIGSPLYMSPEQMRSAKDVDQRTDIWSLGAVLFELLSGRTPFDAETVPNLIAAIMMDPPAELRELRPDLPAELAAVVHRCLEKDVARRFSDVGELSIALSPFAPRRALETAERAARIMGSIPPPAASFAATTPSTVVPSAAPSDAPAPGLATAGVASPVTVRPPPGRTTSGWGGIETPPPKRSRTAPLAAGAAAVAALAVGGYLWFGGGAEPAEAESTVPPDPPSAPVPAARDSPARPVVETAPSVAVSPVTSPSAAEPEPSATAPEKPSAKSPPPQRRVVTKVDTAPEATKSDKKPSKLNMELKP